MRRHASARRPAFTIVEMLVVISIIAVVLAVLLPAFSRIIQSNNYTAARNAVAAMLTRVSQAGVDGGVAFLYDPPLDNKVEKGRFYLVPLELDSTDATLADPRDTYLAPAYLGPRIPAAAYRPSEAIPKVELPPAMAVFGLSFAHDDPQRLTGLANPPPGFARWYQGYGVYGDVNGRRRLTENNWLFPQDSIKFYVPNYDPLNYAPPHPATIGPGDPDNPWRYAQSFFVRFDREGQMLGSAGGAGLPRDAYIEFPDAPYNPNYEPEDPEYFTRYPPINNSIPVPGSFRQPIESRRAFDPNKFYYEQGAAPVLNPEVRLRAVDQIAVVDLAAMIGETGIAAPWWVRPGSASVPNTYPSPTDKATWRDDPNTPAINFIRRTSAYIDQKADIIGFGRYTGQAVKR